MLERAVPLQNMKDHFLASLVMFGPYSSNLDYTYEYKER